MVYYYVLGYGVSSILFKRLLGLVRTVIESQANDSEMNLK
jgi:membrane protein DedA with SNARE-associated domain